MADIETEKMKCVSNERLAELADIYTRAYWASDALSPKAAQTVEDVGIVVQELQRRRGQRCETCEHGEQVSYPFAMQHCVKIDELMSIEDFCFRWQARE